ncbi:MAG: UMP kinase [Magnetococcales bacterium]|nr:UMP kinase [Magnetococcales bacterium]
MSKPRYRRVLVKLSGEALMGSGQSSIDPQFMAGLGQELGEVNRMGVQLGLVVGGGNIFRGVSGTTQGMERTSADHMGMLATVINSLALANALRTLDVPVVVQSAIAMPQIAETFVQRDAVRHLEKGRVVIFAAGTGNPYFTTDTAASLRAAEIGADLLLKGTKVDGVYAADPASDRNAERYDHLTYGEVLARQLRVMDLTAIALCRDNGIPIMVFSILQRGILTAILNGESRGTLIEEHR